MSYTNSEPDKLVSEMLRCAFTQSEKMDLSEQLANELMNKKRCEGRQRARAAEHKREMKQIEEKIEELSDWVANGYQLRNVECSVYFHTPRQGQKTIIRDDTGETVNVALMSSEELQLSMAFRDDVDDEPEEPEEPEENDTEDETEVDDPDDEYNPDDPDDEEHETN